MRERKNAQNMEKCVCERENRLSEAEDEGRKAMRGERGLVLSHGCGSMPSDNPTLTNSEQEVYTENHDSCPQCVCVFNRIELSVCVTLSGSLMCLETRRCPVVSGADILIVINTR